MVSLSYLFATQIDGEATINEPPRTDVFNPAHRERILHPDRRTALTQSSTPTSDLGHMASILSLVLPHANTGSSSIFNQSRPFNERPVTPPTSVPMPTSPVRPTPTKLARFLEYAEDELGVVNAKTFEDRLRGQSYGPDILHLADSSDLKSLGIDAGDVLRLKRGAPDWYNGPLAKRPRQIEDDIPQPPSPHTAMIEEQKVSFERRWKDGTEAKRFWGPGVAEYDGPRSEVWDDTYFCECLQMMVPVPPGYIPLEAGEPREEDLFT